MQRDEQGRVLRIGRQRIPRIAMGESLVVRLTNQSKGVQLRDRSGWKDVRISFKKGSRMGERKGMNEIMGWGMCYK